LALLTIVTQASSEFQFASQVHKALKENEVALEDVVNAGASDPTCSRGLPDAGHRVCCSPKCWACGPHAMCSDNKKFFAITGNNASDCCDQKIKLASRKCEEGIAPCKLSAAEIKRYKADLIKPINEERHKHNRGVVKQRQFRAHLYYKVKKKYDFAIDLARDVKKLSDLKIAKAQARVDKYKKRLAGASALLDAKGPIKGAMDREAMEFEQDQVRFYRMIRRNAYWVAGNASEGLHRVDEMKTNIQINLGKIDSYEPEVKKLSVDSVRVHRDAKVLWRQWQNSAKTMDCNPKAVVRHSKSVAKANTFVRKVKVVCLEGYDSKDSKNNLRCLKQGEFGKVLFGMLSGIATCVGRNCGKPTKINKAKAVVQDIIFPNVAGYTCFEGHSMDGKASGLKSFSVKCGTLGKFLLLPAKHKCQPIRCGAAPVVKNAFPIGGSFVYANVLDYKCMKGHSVDASPGGVKAFEINCQATGEFSSPQKCRPVMCGPPPAYAKTKMLSQAKGDQFYPAELNYGCDKGYTLNQKFDGADKFTLHCHDTGEFTVKGKAGAQIPVCRPVSAGMAPKIPHGNFQSREMFYPESAVVVAVPGYSTLSNAKKGLQFTIKVTANGQYSGVQVFKPVSCGAPAKLAFSKHNFPKPLAVFENFVSYQCSPGYSTDASKSRARAKFTIQCGADGSMSKIPGKGKCVDIDDCASHTCGPFGHCVDKLMNYSCACKKGYEEVFDKKMDEKVCGNINDCGPEACGDGECIDGVDDYSCKCPVGYHNFANAEGKSCARNICGTPPKVLNALTQPVKDAGMKAAFQAKILYHCATGYTITGKTGSPADKNHFRIDCQADKKFTPTKVCKPIQCGEVPKIAHASASAAPKKAQHGAALIESALSATYNQSIKYHCKHGYSIDATAKGDAYFSITCQATGQYGLPMACLPIQCGEPDQVANAQRKSGKRAFGDKVDFQCFNGFTIDGHRDSKKIFSTTCGASGKFSKLETCNPKICGHPPKKISVLFASVPDMGKIHFPQIAEITCRDGYTVGGDPKGKSTFSIKCEANGKFERYDPRECDPVRCGKIPQMANASLIKVVDTATGKTVQADALVFGLRSSYKCAAGFRAGGEHGAPDEIKVECSQHGGFSLPSPELQCRNVNDCDRHTCGPKGKCIDLIGASPAYTCKCDFGFELRTRKNGEKFCGNVDNCGPHECGPGVCRDLVGDYTCVCPSGHYLGIDAKVPGGKEKTCIPVQCAAKPPPVANGKLVTQLDGAIVFPTTLTWQCLPGFSTDSSPGEAKSKFQASCKAHGKLMGVMQCQPVSCGAPHIFAFTHLKFPASKRQVLVFGQSAKYKCFEGYSIKGKKGGEVLYSSVCKKTGVLADPQVCEAVKCGVAPRMPKCRASLAGVVSYGQDVQYECDKGHTLTGTPAGAHHFHRKCKKNGEFEAAHGHCKPIGAGRIPSVRNARVIQWNGRHVQPGEQLNAFYPQGIEYKCTVGYTLNGDVSGQTKFVTTVNSVGNFVPALPAQCKLISLTIKGEVKDARTGASLLGASVKVLGRGGIVLTDRGFFTLSGVKPGQLRLKYTRAGYIPTVKTLSVTNNVHNGGIADINMSPKLLVSQWRAALKWGEKPADLDTYMKWSTASVNWGQRYVSAAGIRGKLEKDDTDGFGPETVFMSGIGACRGGARKCDVKYMINDYDETDSMKEASGAQVTLYNGDKVAGSWKIADCKNAVSEDGNWWHVFTINSATNKLKWHCGMPAMLLDIGSNATLSAAQIETDFDNYVGPFPGRYLRNRQLAKARNLRAKMPQ